MGNDFHAEALRAAGQRLTDPSKTEQASSVPAVDIPGGDKAGTFVPTAGAHPLIRVQNPAHHRQNQPHGEIGAGLVHHRRIRDHHPAPGRSLEIDVIDAGAVTADQAQGGSAVESFGVEALTGNDGCGAPPQFRQKFVPGVGRKIDPPNLRCRRQSRQHRIGHGGGVITGHQYLRLPSHFQASPRSARASR